MTIVLGDGNCWRLNLGGDGAGQGSAPRQTTWVDAEKGGVDQRGAVGQVLAIAIHQNLESEDARAGRGDGVQVPGHPSVGGFVRVAGRADREAVNRDASRHIIPDPHILQRLIAVVGIINGVGQQLALLNRLATHLLGQRKGNRTCNRYLGTDRIRAEVLVVFCRIKINRRVGAKGGVRWQDWKEGVSDFCPDFTIAEVRHITLRKVETVSEDLLSVPVIEETYLGGQ